MENLGPLTISGDAITSAEAVALRYSIDALFLTYKRFVRRILRNFSEQLFLSSVLWVTASKKDMEKLQGSINIFSNSIASSLKVDVYLEHFQTFMM